MSAGWPEADRFKNGSKTAISPTETLGAKTLTTGIATHQTPKLPASRTALHSASPQGLGYRFLPATFQVI